MYVNVNVKVCAKIHSPDGTGILGPILRVLDLEVLLSVQFKFSGDGETVEGRFRGKVEIRGRIHVTLGYVRQSKDGGNGAEYHQYPEGRTTPNEQFVHDGRIGSVGQPHLLTQVGHFGSTRHLLVDLELGPGAFEMLEGGSNCVEIVWNHPLQFRLSVVDEIPHGCLLLENLLDGSGSNHARVPAAVSEAAPSEEGAK